MPRFVFEAIDPNGTVVRGALEAHSHDGALEQLIVSGQTPISLNAAGSQHTLFDRARAFIGGAAFDYISFLRELGTLLKAGLPAERALTVLRDLQSNSKTALRAQQIVERVRNGEALSQAFASVVGEAPQHISRLLAAGEASGNLPEITSRVAAGLIRTRALKSRLVSDLTYPAVLIVAMTAVMWVVFHTVLPRLTPIFSQAGVTMPLPTRILLGVGSFFDTYGWALLVIAMGSVVAFLYAWRQPNVRLIIDRVFVTSRLMLDLPRQFEAAIFCRNPQTVLDGGLPLERALGAARDGIANRWFRAQITNVQKAVSDGQRISHALTKATVLPPLVAEFAAVGEETGRLSAMMQEAADILDQGVQTRLDRLTTLVVPVTTLIMGALVAGLMSGIVSGVLAVNDLAR
ncbi:MAG: type II secretion system F family protein [Rhizomicrobium sp.]